MASIGDYMKDFDKLIIAKTLEPIQNEIDESGAILTIEDYTGKITVSNCPYSLYEEIVRHIREVYPVEYQS
jgi:hypothetical protein